MARRRVFKTERPYLGSAQGDARLHSRTLAPFHPLTFAIDAQAAIEGRLQFLLLE